MFGIMELYICEHTRKWKEVVSGRAGLERTKRVPIIVINRLLGFRGKRRKRDEVITL